MKRIEKLVRDNIPSICKNNGQEANIRILAGPEYTSELRKKLKEEVEEYLLSKELVELADIVEVIEALAEDQGSDLMEIIRLKQEKQRLNGAFKKKVYLISVEDVY